MYLQGKPSVVSDHGATHSHHTPGGSSAGSSSGAGGSCGGEETSPLREQLTKAWKRIADLETRVHDFTLQSTHVSVCVCVCVCVCEYICVCVCKYVVMCMD